jgi:hypothetical protein
VSAIAAHDIQPIYAWHDEILKDHRGPYPARHGKGFAPLGADMEVDAGFVLEGASYHLSNNRLIVDQ